MNRYKKAVSFLGENGFFLRISREMHLSNEIMASAGYLVSIAPLLTAVNAILSL
jgi:hypothetical protein